MAKQQTNDKHGGEFEYQRFLDEFAGARELRAAGDEENSHSIIETGGGTLELVAIDDRFAREVFAYLETNNRFEKKEFVELLAELIRRAAYPSATDKLMSENKERYPHYKGDGTEAAEGITRLFGEAKPFSLPIQPEENKFGNLSFEQKFDLIHFALCALNLLSKTNSHCAPSIEFLTAKRQELILAATREGEHSAASIRAIEANTRDVETEKQWNTGDLSFSEKIEPNGETNAGNESVEADDKNEFSARQKVLALLLLMFGRMEVPDDVKSARVIDFIVSVTDNSRQNIRQFVYNPTKTKDSKRSVKSLCDDLHFVRVQLLQLGMMKAVTSAVSEIDFLLEELEEKSK
ncbi:MAG: hypothetical protein ACR2HG_10740 [Pyrinomonadaceae bacterium]